MVEFRRRRRPCRSYVRDLEQQQGADIGIHASVGLAKSLHDAGLIDDYRLLIAPTFAGRGGACSTVSRNCAAWSWSTAQATESGALLLHYRNR